MSISSPYGSQEELIEAQSNAVSEVFQFLGNQNMHGDVIFDDNNLASLARAANTLHSSGAPLSEDFGFEDGEVAELSSLADWQQIEVVHDLTIFGLRIAAHLG